MRGDICNGKPFFFFPWARHTILLRRFPGWRAIQESNAASRFHDHSSSLIVSFVFTNVDEQGSDQTSSSHDPAELCRNGTIVWFRTAALFALLGEFLM